VLDKSGISINGVPLVMYAPENVDFTNEIIETLNKPGRATASTNSIRSSSNMLASTDSSRTLRFGVVDMQRAFKAWPETKAAEAKINDKKAAAKNEYASQSLAEREKRDKQIEEDAKKLREPIVAKITTTVNTCAGRAGFNLVFDSS